MERGKKSFTIHISLLGAQQEGFYFLPGIERIGINPIFPFAQVVARVH